MFDEITKLVLAMKKNKLAQQNPAITSTGNITVKKGDSGKRRGNAIAARKISDDSEL